MPIESVADHVAIMVPEVAAAAARWHDHLGGGWVLPRFVQDDASFAGRQVRYRNGAKLEILEPAGPEGFAATFLERFGPRIHHVTLKVPSLPDAVEHIRSHGYDVVDVFAEGDVWHEAFLRPSQVGGFIVQVAWARDTDAERAADVEGHPEPPRPDGAELLGPSFEHRDLEAAAALWKVLGAEVEGDDDVLRVGWAHAPLTIELRRGASPTPLGLRFAGTGPLAYEEATGAAVLTATP